jgi:hypothetical protein
MFEHHSEPILPRPLFIRRLAHSAATALSVVLVSLLIGMVGYRSFEGLAWLDAFLNAAMLLGGMGPVTPLVTSAGKIFAGLYALYCGFVVIFTAGMLLTPVAHRFLHKFHLERGKE